MTYINVLVYSLKYNAPTTLPAGDMGEVELVPPFPPHSCSQQAASLVHYTTSCKHSVAEDGRNYRPKHVELIEIINKTIIVASSWLYIIVVSEYWIK